MRRPAALLAAVTLLAVTAALAGSAVAVPPSSSATTPRNVILFVVDGMGPEQVALGRAMKGSPLSVDGIPWQTKGTLDTDSLEGVTDSAAGATALASGAETNNGWLGMVPAPGGSASVPTALEYAEDRGKATGLVTDSYITDATPGAFAAHVTSRSQTREIATQMAAQDVEILLGGGLRQAGVGPLLGLDGVAYVRNAAQVNGYTDGGPVYGFFDSWNMVYNLDREEEGVVRKDPTLPQMTAAALRTLSQEDDGFFLMVEGGLVDWGGHARDAASMGVEMIETDEAVKVAYNWAKDRSDTLIVFTADHETGGFGFSAATDLAGLRGQTATTEFMWGRIAGGAGIRSTVQTHTGLALTAAEIATVRTCGEHGISDVLAQRWGLSWNGTCTQEGDHTATPVPVWAWGPGHADFAGISVPNEIVGDNLLAYFS
ncbi:MAG TPA: alkaline phosphatase [Actinomycetota bacterium]|nr:alkaline phosphatase [Actinomycetota bacterium]